MLGLLHFSAHSTDVNHKCSHQGTPAWRAAFSSDKPQGFLNSFFLTSQCSLIVGKKTWSESLPISTDKAYIFKPYHIAIPYRYGLKIWTKMNHGIFIPVGVIHAFSRSTLGTSTHRSSLQHIQNSPDHNYLQNSTPAWLGNAFHWWFPDVACISALKINIVNSMIAGSSTTFDLIAEESSQVCLFYS